MALQNYQYDAIMREYSQRQLSDRHALEGRRHKAYEAIPRLAEIDSEEASLSASRVRSLLCGQSSSLGDLKEQIDQLSRERASLLCANGFPSDHLEMHYVCPHCQDTGYVDGKKCSCFKQIEIDLLYNQSNIRDILEKENFVHFSFEWYSDTIRNKTTGLSARETARIAYDTAQEFVRNFDSCFQNLFLYGSTGVGKTFLSNCIAGELLKSSHSVLYFSAFDLFDCLAQETFSHREESFGSVNPVFDCDLLIIDDLGTELNNSFVSSQLFLCVNERILRKKPTIISTNLTLEEFSNAYSERTMSRITSNYQLLKLIGKDIRIEKKFLGGN